jgi:hypothetical protein
MSPEDKAFMDRLADRAVRHRQLVPNAKYLAVNRRTFLRIQKITGMDRPALTDDRSFDVEIIQDRSLADGVLSFRINRDGTA